MASLRMMALIGVVATTTAGAAGAQTNPDTGVTGVCVSNCGTSSSTTSGPSDGGLVGALIREIFKDRSDERRARGTELNNQGVQIEKAGNLDEALRLYRRALELNSHPTIKANIARLLARRAWLEVESGANRKDLSGMSRAEATLAEAEQYNIPGGPDYQAIAGWIVEARAMVAEARAYAAREAQNRQSLADASRTVEALTANVAKALTSNNTHTQTNALAFGDPPSSPESAPAAIARSTAVAMPVGDPMVVDARNRGSLPPGVPRLEEVENSPGKEAWLRGMDAVVQRDWQLATAWFQTALQRDPTNPALGRAVELAKWTWERQKGTNPQGGTPPSRAEPPSPAKPVDAPTAAEMARLEAVLDKMLESQFQPAPVPTTLSAEQAAERRAVEKANLALANQLGGQAILEVQRNDLPAAIEILRVAELLAPQVPNFRATRDWLQSQVSEANKK